MAAKKKRARKKKSTRKATKKRTTTARKKRTTKRASKKAPVRKKRAKKRAAAPRAAPRRPAKKKKGRRLNPAQRVDELRTGDFVKAAFQQGRNTEKMWVRITAITSKQLIGKLDNKPLVIRGLRVGDLVPVKRSQVLETLRKRP